MIQLEKQAGTRICGNKTGLGFEEMLCKRPDRFFWGAYIFGEEHNKGAR